MCQKERGEKSKLFERIDALKCTLDEMRPFTQGELSKLRETFMVEYTYNSNAIEGNSLTLHETAMVLQGLTIDKKPLKDHLEVIGHRDAYYYIEKLAKNNKPISAHVIKEIHSMVLADQPLERGKYRATDVIITGTEYVPPTSKLVPKEMNKLILDASKSNVHWIEKTAQFHFNLESIHPFIDGNGRTGRLVLNLMLMKKGYPPIDIKFTDRKRYYDCFKTQGTTNDTLAMTYLVAEYVEQKLLNQIKLLQDREDVYEMRKHEGDTNEQDEPSL